MERIRTLTTLVPVLLIACDTVQVDSMRPSDETIVYKEYSSGFCFPPCTNHRFKILPDGRGIFVSVGPDGETRQSFRATPTQVRRFQDLLRPFRPRGEQIHDCAQDLTQGESVETLSHAATYEVRWFSPSTGNSHLQCFAGFEPTQNRKLLEALENAPQVLPVGKMIAALSPSSDEELGEGVYDPLPPH